MYIHVPPIMGGWGDTALWVLEMRYVFIPPHGNDIVSPSKNSKPR